MRSTTTDTAPETHDAASIAAPTGITRRNALLGGALLLAPFSPRLLAATPASAPAVSLEGAHATLIRLDSNENPYGPSPAARRAIAASIPAGCRYADGDLAPLKQALAAQEKVVPSQVVLGTGSSELLHMAALLAAEPGPGGELIAAQPTFEDLEEFAAKFGVTTRWVPVDAAHRHDLKAMRAALTPQTRLVYICNPNNPTGTIVGRRELESFIRSIPVQTLVLVDEAYLDFVTAPDSGSVVPLISDCPNLIVLRTFSKLHGLAGMRMGYGFAAPPLIKRLEDKQLAFPNVAALRGALASLGDQEFLTSTRRSILADRIRLESFVDRLGYTRAQSQGNFVFFEVRQPITAFKRAMLERGISVGRPFVGYDQWCRLTVGTTQEVDRVLAVMPDLLKNTRGA